MALAIFDLDNTLIAGDSDHAWGEFLIEQGVVDATHYQQKNDQFYRDYQNGSLKIEEYLEFALAPLANNTLADLYKWREIFFDLKIKPMMLPLAEQLVASHKANNDTLLIITATNRFVTEPIANAFGIAHLIATEPERDQQGFTGKITGVPSFKDGKITRLNQWLELNPCSMDGSYFYSDSHNDLPLLKLVEFPVAIDPDDELRKHCEAQGWPVRSLRQNQV